MPSSTDENLSSRASGEACDVEPDRPMVDKTLSGVKRKEMEARKKPSFKVIGHMVLAMRRFSEALNPTYTYGKRTTSSSGGGSKLVTEDAEAVVTSGEKRLERPPSAGARATSPEGHGHEHLKYAYSSHGHKFDFLIKPLPATEEEEAEAAAANRQ